MKTTTCVSQIKTDLALNSKPSCANGFRRKHKFRICFLVNLLSFIGLSCSQNETSTVVLNYDEEKASLFKKKYSLSLVDSVEITIDSTIMKENISISAMSKNSISILNRRDLAIYDYNVKEKKIEKKSQFYSDGPNAFGPFNTLTYYCRTSKDEILLFNQSTQTLFFANTSGRIIKKYKIDNFKYYAIPYETHPIFTFNDDVFIPIAPSEWAFVAKLSNIYTYLKINKSTGKQDYQFPIPEIYKKYYWTDNHVFYAASILNMGNKLLVSFPVDPNLFIYSKESNDKKYISASEMASFFPYARKLPNITEKIAPKPIDPVVKRNLLLNSNYFLNLFYFSDKNCFVRVARVGKPKHKNIPPHYAIIFFDDKIMKTGETKILFSENGRGDFWENAIQVGNKIWVPTGTEHENRLKYNVYEIANNANHGLESKN